MIELKIPLIPYALEIGENIDRYADINMSFSSLHEHDDLPIEAPIANTEKSLWVEDEDTSHGAEVTYEN